MMEGINSQYLLLAFLGMVIHVLMKILNRDKKDNKFSLKVFFKDSMNWVRIGLTICSIIAILLMKDDIADIMGITLSDNSPAKSILAFGAGYVPHSILRNVLKLFEKK